MPVVEVEVDGVDVDLAADALWQAGASAVSEEGRPDGRVRLVADVADEGRVPARWGARVVAPDVAADLDAWRAWARPWRAGQCLVVQPAWLEPAATDPDDLVLTVDPGRAFGSGSHPSTRLVLGVLEQVVCRGDRVLDVGCGSGVLAVAACRLGAVAATGVDVDPAALEATVANAARNGVGDQLEVHRDLTAVTGSFDVVVANIGQRVLVQMADELAARVAREGTLVLAGLLEDQAAAVLAALPGWTEVDRPGEDGWVAPVLRR